MAEDLTKAEAPVAPVAPEAPAASVMPPQPSGQPHRARFLLIYAALVAILVAAIVGVVLFASHSISPGPRCSAWKPSGGVLGTPTQIADHVSSAYHLPSGEHLGDAIA